MARRNARRFRLRREAPRYVVQRRELAGAGDSIAKFFESGPAELGQARPCPLAVRADEEVRRQRHRGVPRTPAARTGRSALRHALEPRHESFACVEFVDLMRKRGAAIVTACDSEHPRIADLTADFAYLRAMGNERTRKGRIWPEGAGRLGAARGERSRRANRCTTRRSSRLPPRRRRATCSFYFISGFRRAIRFAATAR